MSKVLFCHDNVDFASTRGEILQTLFGHEVTVCTTAHSSINTVKLGIGGFDTVIVHKDLGLGIESIDSERVVSEIHESAPYVRVGIISGEFPDGKKHVINTLQADFYLEPNTALEWCDQQIARGFVSSEERSRRGKEVAMP